ncbi:sensor histidine kinase [Vibrio sinaloensis]|uniref:sensor histidine kinase n=1 Tax=Photobacterium sp. (strain ATCC 43367) TaxID=379097 RepID=UPI002064D518|nr:sensor histidine kinase [Vibrio sinaloensis]UPQ89268.1 sensor histidine kinase [Vibrio sinaloensis]
MTSSVFAQRTDERREFDVGILALRGHHHTQQQWQPTIDWLNDHPEYHFNLHTYDFKQLDEAFRQQKLDFILTSPGQATKLAREFPVSWLATQKTAFSDIPNKSIASVVIVANNSRFKQLADIDRAKIAAVSEQAFGGFLVLRYELDRLGLFHNKFFNNIQCTGPPTDNIILDMLAGRFEVAIVPACTLESLVSEGKVSLDQVRVLNEKRPANSVCRVSTPLYANWTFAMSERCSTEVGQYVMQRLFSLEADSPAALAAGNLGWMLPVPSVSVDNVYKHLDLHPLQKTLQQKIYHWLDHNRPMALSFILLLLLVTLYHFWLQWRFKRNQARLTKVDDDLRRKSALLEHAQRVTIVGELGSSLAHELNQPLAVIKNYSQGASKQLEQGIAPEQLEVVLQKIQQQVNSASDIVQRLRGLINKKPTQKRNVDMIALINESIALVSYEYDRAGVEIHFEYSGLPKAVFGDAIGLQQVVINLLTNAKDACVSRQPLSQRLIVEVHLIYTQETVYVEIIDNGIGFDSSAIPLETAFYTTKPHGIGLGLAICRDVIESHHGSIRYRPIQPSGCQVSVELPYKEQNNAK